MPIIVLIAIAIPSFGLLKFQLAPTEEPALTVKATGNQWYWGYEYQDETQLSFDSIMLSEEDRPGSGKEDMAAYPRLLAVDNELVVPVGKMVRVLVTAADVLHSFAVPALRLQDRRRPRPPERNLVQGRPGGHFLRAMFRALRQGSCLHADRDPGGERRTVHCLACHCGERSCKAPTRR